MKNWTEYEFVIDEEQHLAMPGERTGWETVIFQVGDEREFEQELAAIYAYIDALRDS